MQDDVNSCRIVLTSKKEATMRMKEDERSKRKKKNHSGAWGCEVREYFKKVTPWGKQCNKPEFHNKSDRGILTCLFCFPLVP